jgi:MATE family multidrug resistance protein
MVSLVAEPLTGLVDTFFVARLGEVPLAALGVATMMLSSVLWIFNFLGIGTQTEVAHADGFGNRERAAGASRLAMTFGFLLGIALALAGWPLLEPATRWMGASREIAVDAVAYLRIRLLGSPATLVMIAAFGALRGLQDMRTPLRIALVSNALNLLLDPILIFGWGPAPGWGVAGAAWASVASQWLAAIMSLCAVHRRLAPTARLRWHQIAQLLVTGRDLVMRTGLLLLFLLIATRSATQAGAPAGAAHQVIRVFWFFTALVLDAYAASAQSLIGYFVGAGDMPRARRVAAVACQWGLASGVVLALAMLGLRSAVAAGIPAPARELFVTAWCIAALAQPLSALSFVTDGIHWGTALISLDPHQSGALEQIWLVTTGWLAIRTVFGLVRVWPGFGASPLRAVGDRL